MVNPHRTADDLKGQFRAGAVTIGNFDGVHRGHAELISRLRRMADRLGGPAVAVTFDPAPAAILRPGGVPPQLTTIDRRTELLKQCGVDHVFVCKTDQDLLGQTPEEFFSRLVVTELAALGMVEGPNFFFGRNRAGDTQLLGMLCQDRGIELEIVAPQSESSLLISSTRVRELLVAGSIGEANRLLTSPYRIRGTVVQGASRGREIGFPTANLSDVATLVPGLGVYACRVLLDDSQVLAAAVHIGPNPTFGEASVKIEVHLLDFEGDLYGTELEVDFIARVRGIVRFDSSTDLIDQLRRDVAGIRNRLSLKDG
jgi:riboflavin kinase/FMN adenylyltransferase